MKADKGRSSIKASVLAVQAALAAMAIAPAAHAVTSVVIDPQVEALIHPDNTPESLIKPNNFVEIGGLWVSDDSAKFGEYNGLDKSGGYLNLNLDVRGGGYGSDTDATRWKVVGTDLGLRTRDIQAEYRDQGKFKLNLGYDELQRNRSDTYQTPYSGAGGNNFTLPSDWVVPRVPQVSATGTNFRGLDPTAGLAPALVNGQLKQPTAAQTATVNNQIAHDRPAFQNVDLYTRRERYDGGFSYNLTPQWEFKASVRHEDKTGYKPMGTVTSQVSEFSATLPDPIDQSTDQYNASINYTGEKGFFQAAYYGSMFKNNVNSLTWQDVSDPTKSATMSSAPDNQFHQFGMTGGYNFSKTMKLVVNGSYARATQNESFLSVAQNNQLPLGLPVNSLDGLVVTKIFNAKFTATPMPKFNIVASYKYDDRDNQTPVNTYIFQDANEARAAAASPFNSALGLAPNTLGSNINIYDNRAYSKRLNQFDLQGNYRITSKQAVDLSYQYQKIDRWCNGSWIDCMDADSAKENTLRGEWRGQINEAVLARVSYAYSQRRVDNYNENAFLALVPMANQLGVGGAATNGSTVATITALQYMMQNGLTGYGPLAGYNPPYTGNQLIYGNNGGIIPQALYGSRNNINELPGMRRFDMADRNRDKLRGMLNWDATERLSFQASGDYNNDDYTNSVFGLKSAKSYMLDFDGTFAFSDTLTATLFYTYQDSRSKSAGDAYGSNSNTASVNGFTTIDPAVCYGTILQRNLNAKQDPCLVWNTDMHDKTDTLGLSLRKSGLLGGKLMLGADFTWSRAKTDVNVMGGSYANNPLAITGAPAGTTAAFYIPAGPLPTVVYDQTLLRLAGEYHIDKKSTVGALYIYGHLSGQDWFYQGTQFGSGTNYLPTNEQFPAYSVHVVGVSYIYRFQ